MGKNLTDVKYLEKASRLTDSPENFSNMLSFALRMTVMEKQELLEIMNPHSRIRKILDYLKKKKQPIALGSASKNAKPILEKVGLLSYFDTIVDGNNVTKAKPDPEVFLLAAEQLGVKPQDCTVFEDAVAGIEAANRANMVSIGIGDKEILSEAKFNFEDFTQFDTNFIKELIKKQ